MCFPYLLIALQKHQTATTWNRSSSYYRLLQSYTLIRNPCVTVSRLLLTFHAFNHSSYVCVCDSEHVPHGYMTQSQPGCAHISAPDLRWLIRSHVLEQTVKKNTDKELRAHKSSSVCQHKAGKRDFTQPQHILSHLTPPPSSLSPSISHQQKVGRQAKGAATSSQAEDLR